MLNVITGNSNLHRVNKHDLYTDTVNSNFSIKSTFIQIKIPSTIISLAIDNNEIGQVDITDILRNENFIADFEQIVNWKMISQHQILSEDFIRKYKYKVYWEEIAKYQKLSESFIREFKNKLSWFGITRNQVLSEEFIIEFEKKITQNHKS